MASTVEEINRKLNTSLINIQNPIFAPPTFENSLSKFPSFSPTVAPDRADVQKTLGISAPTKPAVRPFNLPRVDPNRPVQLGEPVRKSLFAVGRNIFSEQIASTATEENPAVRQVLLRGSFREAANFFSTASAQAFNAGLSLFQLEFGAKLKKAEALFQAGTNLDIEEFRQQYGEFTKAMETAMNQAFEATKVNDERAFRVASAQFVAAESRANNVFRQAGDKAITKLQKERSGLQQAGDILKIFKTGSDIFNSGIFKTDPSDTFDFGGDITEELFKEFQGDPDFGFDLFDEKKNF